MVETASKISFRMHLESWHSLERKKLRLAESIPRQQALLDDIVYKPPDWIMGKITQHYQGMDMPRGSDITDKTGNIVADADERQVRIAQRIASMRLEYADICSELEQISVELCVLSDRHQQVLTLFYRDKAPWYDICQRILHVSRSRMYEMIDEAIDAIDGAMWRGNEN